MFALINCTNKGAESVFHICVPYILWVMVISSLDVAVKGCVDGLASPTSSL